MEISSIEAMSIITDGTGIVTNGSYTFFKDHYLAYGTIPACIRRGDINTLFREGWSRITIRELVLDVGFYPSETYLDTLLELQASSNDHSVDLHDMKQFVDNNPDHRLDLFDMSNKARELWTQYFKAWDSGQ